MRELTADENAARERFLHDSSEAIERTWTDWWEGLLRLDPEFFEASVALVDAHWHHGALEPLTKEFVSLAMALQVSTRHLPAARRHMVRALDLGATPTQLIEVFELACLQGMSSLAVGVPDLLDQLRAAGGAIDEEPLTPEQQELRDEFVERGPRPRAWGPAFDGTLRLDPTFFSAVHRFIDAPWKLGQLEPKIKELITVAVALSCTNRYEGGVRRHIGKAIAEGATAAEVFEVIAMTTNVGLISCVVGIPILMEVLDERSLL